SSQLRPRSPTPWVSLPSGVAINETLILLSRLLLYCTLVAAFAFRQEDEGKARAGLPGGRENLDPVTLITSALLGGASAGLKDTATQSVKDAYAGLKRLIHRRFHGRNEAEV